MKYSFGPDFVELIRTPFQHLELVWGIVPLYFGWLCGELVTPKKSFRTAFQTGFSLLWAGAQWTFQYFQEHPQFQRALSWDLLGVVNVVVTLLVLLIGVLALVSGWRRRYPPYASFLGHARFSHYFMIAIFPMQARYLTWSWDRLIAVLLFATPVWLLAHYGLAPLRKRAR